MGIYKAGDIVEGIVTGINDYGFFVSFDDGYSGLVHISEISNGFVKDITNYVCLNDKISVEVISVDDESKKLKLSLKKIYNDTGTEKKKKIKETKTGFTNLGVKLYEWMDEFDV